MQQYNKTVQKMINFDDAVKKTIKEHNPSWLQIPDHSYRILLTGGSGSEQQIHYLI